MRCSKGLLVASFFAFSLIASPALAADAPMQPPKDTDIVMKINGAGVTRGELDTATDKLLPYMTYHQTVSDERFAKVRKKAVNNLIDSELIYSYSKANKLNLVTSKDIDKEIKGIRKKLPPGESLEKALKRSKMTMADLKEEYRKNLTVQRVSTEKKKEFKKKAEEKVDDKFLREYYDNNLEKFKEPERLRLRSILIKADPSGGTKAWNESKKKADDIIELAKSGEDFAKLAKERSEDINAANGGDMGWAHVGSIFEEIEAAVETAKEGDIVGPVMTLYGYHIVKVEGRMPSVQKKFEELNIENLRDELRDKEQINNWKDWIKDLRDKATIEYVDLDIKP